jgi:hypothetical protein
LEIHLKFSGWFLRRKLDFEIDKAKYFRYNLMVANRGVAQLVERRSPKPVAAGSIPVSPAIFKQWLTPLFLFISQFASLIFFA